MLEEEESNVSVLVLILFFFVFFSVVQERAAVLPRQVFLWRRTVLVSQELMLCYVVYPTDQSEAELDSPECLSRLKVQEVIVGRWVSSRERAEQDDI
uniref:Secreted protein n=1 Tax=Amphiprion ocellaris TaxID=80972 RepID=A0AAQ5WZS2_AMPOC